MSRKVFCACVRIVLCFIICRLNGSTKEKKRKFDATSTNPPVNDISNQFVILPPSEAMQGGLFVKAYTAYNESIDAFDTSIDT